MKRSRFFFLLFILFFPFVALPLANATLEAEVWKDVAITGSDLEVQITGLNSNIHKYVSGGTLGDAIESLSAVPVTNSNLILFKSRVFVTFSVVFWTELLPDDALSATPHENNVEWLWLKTYSECLTGADPHEYHLIAYYNQFEDIKLNTGANGFRGLVNITPSLGGFTPLTMTFGNDVIEIKSREFYAIPKELLVMDANRATIGDYTTKVQKVGETKLDVVDVEGDTIETAAQYGGDAEQALRDAIGTLGVFRQDITTFTMSGGGGAQTLPSIGANLLENQLDLTLKPDIKLINEPLLVKYRSPLVVDIQTNWYAQAAVSYTRSSGPLEQTIPDRIIGWIVTNYATKVDLQCEFELYSLCEVEQIEDPEKPGLEYPLLYIADYYWKSLIGGDTGATIEFDSTSWFADFFNQLWQQYWWVFVLIGIALLSGGFIYIRFFTPVGKAMGAIRPKTSPVNTPSRPSGSNKVLDYLWGKLT